MSAADAFLKPALKRPNLTYQGHTTVATVLFDGNRAIGVRARSKGVVRDYFANKEVILAGGAVESPMLLERSGIGDPDILHAAGVPVRVESPNVGKRVLEQRLVPYQARIREPLGGYNTMYGSTLRQMWQGVKYLATRGGFIASGAHDIAVFFKSSPDAPRADVFGNINPITLDLAAEGIGVGPDAGFSFTGYALHPTTEGSIHISGSEPENAPVIDARFLETDYDRKATVAAVERMREIAAQAPLADLIVEEQAPGPQATEPEDIIGLAWAAGNVFHATGSAAMGPEDDDVVDGTLRVRGTEGLRVADTSVFPINPGNPQGPTMALGWRAADIILRDTE